MPLTRYALRLLVVLAGFGVGFGAAAVLTGAAFNTVTHPRCPRCGSRHNVHPVVYRPVPGNNTLSALSKERYIGTWDPDKDGPLWYCNKCSHGWGNRFAPPRR